MSDNGDNKPAMQDDVITAVVILMVLMTFFSMADSCTSHRHYLDLRDRLERLEQRR